MEQEQEAKIVQPVVEKDKPKVVKTVVKKAVPASNEVSRCFVPDCIPSNGILIEGVIVWIRAKIGQL